MTLAFVGQTRLISAKCKQYLAFMLRERQQRGVVDFVFSGQRLKVLVPKENCIVSFSLSGIRCPQAPRLAASPDASASVAAGAAGAAGGAAAGEPFGEDAWRLTRALCLQQDVTLEVEGLDKGDNFLGSLLVASPSGGAKPLNLAVELLAAGLAQVVPFSADKSPYREELLRAEARAKDARIGVRVSQSALVCLPPCLPACCLTACLIACFIFLLACL
jgi:staphylococcal nuclease domain-containing protein 1